MKQANQLQSIPLVDVGPLVRHGSTLEQRRLVAAQIGQACQHVGFFYIWNHGIPEGNRVALFDHMRRFFALPLERKMDIFIGKSKHFRGYIPLGGEVTQGLRDWHEALDFRSEFAEDHSDVLAGKPLHGPNQWPCDLPGFRQVMEEHWNRMIKLGEWIAKAIALSLGLEEEFLEAFTENAFCNMRILHYPVYTGAKDSSIGEGIGPHCDYGFITILDQDETSGPEVMNAGGEWVPAPYIPGTYLVNIGRVTQIWTNDRYQATQHRVRSSQIARYSVPFFYNPSFDTIIEPLPICCDSGNPARYDAYCHGEFVAERFEKSFGANFTSMTY